MSALIGSRRFPFPKSLYAVEDALRFFTNTKPDAVILDFFAGSGTTTHAVMRLNRQDGGLRKSISVTNNEVSAAEAVQLRTNGARPGDPEWESSGIFEQITRPRITAAITGLTPKGEPVKGDYKFTDEFPMAEGFEENVEFFELTYQDAGRIELHHAFEAIAPLLWLRAGATGRVISEARKPDGQPRPYDYTDSYGVLFNADHWRAFVDELPDTVKVAFLVTDSQTTFATVTAELATGVEAVRLYRNFLSTFEIGSGV